LVEGGGTLLGSLVAGHHAQRIVAYVAPLLLGTRGTPGFVFDGPESIDLAQRFDLVRVDQVGADARLELEPKRGVR
jgi:diaminohydroxyphosphoribosylaminopyrimidine deaminase/5-amino-6-(5-phosphoribosylamino)uracil reductase